MSSTTEFKTINSRLQSLEAALQAQNESHEQILSNTRSAGGGGVGVGGVGSGVARVRPTITMPNSAAAAAASSTLNARGIPTIGGGGGVGGGGVQPVLGMFGNSSFVQQTNSSSSSSSRGMRPTPNLPISQGSLRSRGMVLPLPTQHHPSETETDKKLKMIMGQTGKLNINGRQYTTDINDLQHLGDLGNGTSGNVVKMLHLASDTVIAVKQMRRTGNAEENKRILMDLDVVLKSHDCKYIVKCLGCFVRDADVWICMELMSMCFDKLLKLSKKPVPEPILGKVTVATVNALSYLKDKHLVIHRDVKPSNILIDERGNIKLCDFGISGRLVDSKANTRSAGCAAYMAPERIDPKKPKYDIRADVWSLGITLVELATARSPYEGCNTDFEVLTKVLDSEPPCLPRGEGFNFSQEFHDFVIKCLTKNLEDRPKYPELLAQPFIKYYEKAKVDVPSWFQNVVDTAAGRRLRANGDPRTTTITPTTTTTKEVVTKYGKNISTSIGGHEVPHHPMTLTGETTGGGGGAATATGKTIKPTQIPSYQQLPHFIQSATQLPQTATTTIPTTTTTTTPGAAAAATATGIGNYYGSGGGGGGSGSGGSGSSSANSASPLSPPGGGSDLNKFYRKSPFMHRKLSNGANNYHNHHYSKYNDESPKKESMFSSIGQSILRNLTTSPFSQKKHNLTQTLPHNHSQSIQQQQQQQQLQMPMESPQLQPLPSLWHPPHQEINLSSAYSGCDSSNNMITGHSSSNGASGAANGSSVLSSPALQRKQPGNQSPIVLQRFYHQQNQLREKEAAERLQQQQQQHRPAPPLISTNPFHSNYAAPSSSHSTSSQSSTQSTCSQIAINAGVAASSIPAIPAPAAGHFGVGSAAQLQYQPLPMQAATGRATTPLTSPEQPQQFAGGITTTDFGVGVGSAAAAGSPVASKLSKLYARRQLLGQSSSSGASTTSLDGSGNYGGKEHGYGPAPDAGWFNTLAGAMKRQFANYVKTQLNNSTVTSPSGTPGANAAATAAAAAAAANGNDLLLGLESTTTPQPPAYRSIINNSGGGGGKSYYYRTLSATSSSSNTSQSTSPTTEPLPRSELTSGSGSGGGGTSGFLRRYASGGGGLGGSSSTPPSPHILAGLDRRHRSPDPPPRYNRGQSPLLLRKNLLELSGQPPGSPLLQRRYVSASPPLPPPRRGSESVPGSPQHFRTRIHYTPEPQRRIYRTIDQ